MAKLRISIKALIILFVSLIVVAFLGQLILNAVFKPPQKVEYGVSFSPNYARYLGLDARETYLKILDQLKVRNLRLPTFWDNLEREKGKYDFSETDFMLEEAVKRNVKVILVVGVRQPRWPECHIPIWAKSLPLDQRQQKALEIVQKAVERYKDNQSVWAWQVENEPFLSFFGEGCDPVDTDFLKKEVALVRSLSSKKIIMTDSGELGLWATSMQMSDIFGTTLYRKVNDKTFGYVTYPMPAYLYNIKSGLVRSIFAPKNQKTVIVELQAEPWLAGGDFISPDKQAKILTVKDFESYINFGRKTGFDGAYLWGVEWWYFMAANGHPEYLDYARILFK